ncbi:MAG: tRNA (adenosine(37)-N6)-threonylcarbamoyltransferase complex ATPase subunit type 1 TsaE [Proteobacteria bacterium]|nr:tRNA (adenosine(37)-N6)-threonylcarbamoyltransferase complex ATPase subunit type 1 TsaE [Pseudomonadota bacterium]
MKYFSGLVSELADDLKKEKMPYLIFLEGPLGAGKTTFSQEFLEHLGVESGAVKSPTFLKMLEYTLPQGKILHIDCYRMDHFDDVAKLSLEHYSDQAFLYLVEWPENFEKYLEEYPEVKSLISFKRICRIKIKLSGENRIVQKVWENF